MSDLDIFIIIGIIFILLFLFISWRIRKKAYKDYISRKRKNK
jgi:FtsZ-interacting cell division protein ZipA